MKAQRIPRITIGIAAHNEANGIGRVLRGILDQQVNGWTLDRIHVYCDGCTDKTASIARSIRSSNIVVHDDGQQLGKTARLQQMFASLKTEYLIMFDGDISFASNKVITQLLEPFLKNSRVMLVGGNSTPEAPKSFFQKAVYSTFRVFYHSRILLGGGHNIFGATGSILAIRKQFSDTVTFPRIVNEDAYLYLDCLAKGFVFRYVDNAMIHYTLPNTVTDYIKQVFRSEPVSLEAELTPYFGEAVKNQTSRPFVFYLKSILQEFFVNPIGVVFMTILNILARPLAPFVIRNYKLSWFTATSTK